MWKGRRAQFFFLVSFWKEYGLASSKENKILFQTVFRLPREGRVKQHLLWIKNIKMAESDKLLLKSLSQETRGKIIFNKSQHCRIIPLNFMLLSSCDSEFTEWVYFWETS